MKILLDECLPIDFRHSFPNHEVHTAEWAGLKSKKNGELLLAADMAGYEVKTIGPGQIVSIPETRLRQNRGNLLNAPTESVEQNILLQFDEPAVRLGLRDGV
jgi:hypothetical protein